MQAFKIGLLLLCVILVMNLENKYSPEAKEVLIPVEIQTGTEVLKGTRIVLPSILKWDTHVFQMHSPGKITVKQGSMSFVYERSELTPRNEYTLNPKDENEFIVLKDGKFSIDFSQSNMLKSEKVRLFYKVKQ